ncbi:hypothetical protein D3C59_34020 [Streptomyces sp. SHP22-7]|nr:hypothetical protein D3C59_34020 [Streptomyces sp. SHP22-7]
MFDDDDRPSSGSVGQADTEPVGYIGEDRQRGAPLRRAEGMYASPRVEGSAKRMMPPLVA